MTSAAFSTDEQQRADSASGLAASNVRTALSRQLRQGYGLAAALSRGLGAVTGFAITLLLLPSERGIYAFYYAVVLALVQFGPFAFDQALSGWIARNGSPVNSRRIGIGLSLGAGAPVLVATSALIAVALPSSQTSPLRFLAVTSAVLVLWTSGVLLGELEGRGAIRERYVLHSMLPIIFLASIAVNRLTYRVSADSLLVCLAVSSVATLFVRESYWRLRVLPATSQLVPVSRITRRDAIDIARAGVALSPSQLGTILVQRADVILAGVLLTSVSAGNFSVAATGGMLASFYSEATGRSLYSSTAAGRSGPLRAVIVKHTLLSLTVALLIPVIIIVFYDPAYAPAASLSVLLTTAWWLRGIGVICDGVLRGKKLSSSSAAANWAALICLLGLSVPLSARMGGSGLALASVLSGLVFALFAVSRVHHSMTHVSYEVRS